MTRILPWRLPLGQTFRARGRAGPGRMAGVFIIAQNGIVMKEQSFKTGVPRQIFIDFNDASARLVIERRQTRIAFGVTLYGAVSTPDERTQYTTLLRPCRFAS